MRIAARGRKPAGLEFGEFEQLVSDRGLFDVKGLRVSVRSRQAAHAVSQILEIKA